MKTIISTLAIAGSIALTGCATSPMVQEGSTEKYINGYTVHVENYNKIPDKNVSIQFKVAEGSDIGEFRWNEVQEDVLSLLKDKGVNVTNDGRPVTVTLEHFIAWGSNHAKHKVATGYIPGGTIMSIGGSFAQDVLVTAVDRKIAKKNARDELKRDSGDGKNFVPDVRFSIESLDYKTRLNMVSAGAAGNYLYMSKKLTAQAISDFFQGTK